MRFYAPHHFLDEMHHLPDKSSRSLHSGNQSNTLIVVVLSDAVFNEILNAVLISMLVCMHRSIHFLAALLCFIDIKTVKTMTQ